MPWASAQDGVVGRFQASKVYASGTTEGEPALVGLAKLHGRAVSPWDHGVFHLDAPSLDLERVESKATVYTGVVAFSEFPSSQWTHYDAANLLSAQPKDDFELVVTPTPGAPAPTVHVSSGCS